MSDKTLRPAKKHGVAPYSYWVILDPDGNIVTGTAAKTRSNAIEALLAKLRRLGAYRTWDTLRRRGYKAFRTNKSCLPDEAFGIMKRGWEE